MFKIGFSTRPRSGPSATGLTWMAVRGDDPLKIKQRAGHSTFSTTGLYIRQAEAVREGFGQVFPTLPDSLLGLDPVWPDPNLDDESSQNEAVSGGGAGNRIACDVRA